MFEWIKGEWNLQRHQFWKMELMLQLVGSFIELQGAVDLDFALLL